MIARSLYRILLAVLCVGWWSNGRAANRVDSLKNAVAVHQAEGDRVATAEAYLALGEEHFHGFDHDSALAVLKNGLELALQTDDQLLKFRFLDLLGNTLFWLDQYQEAIEYHWQAAELIGPEIPAHYQAANYAHIGEIYISLGNLREALEYELRARDLSESVNDSIGMAAAHDKLGHIYWQLHRYETALEQLKAAQRIYEASNQSIYLYQTKAALSQVHKDLGQPERAMREARSSLQLARQLGYAYGVAFSTGMIGSVFTDLQVLDSAEIYLTRSIEYFEAAEIRYESAEFAVILAKVHLKRRDLDAAEALLQEALEIGEEIQSLALKVSALQHLSEVYELRGDYPQALTYLQAFQVRQDSLLNADNLQHANHLETEYELRKRERQIDQLEAQAEIERNRFLLIAATGGAILLLVVLWLLYARYRSQGRYAREQAARSEAFERQNAALSTANAELRRFSDLAAHDLRQPVEALRKVSEALQELPAEADEQREALHQRLTEGLAQLDTLLAGVAAFAIAKPEPGQWEPLDLSEMLKAAIRGLPESERRQATRVQIAPLPVVPGIRHQLVQLFQHLLSNAIHFGSDGEPQIEVSAQPRGGQQMIMVRDHGRGIPAKDLPRIFDLFYQGENAEAHSGSGIGLAIARRIVQQHGGKIWAESQPGKGTTIYFTLPVERELS